MANDIHVLLPSFSPDFSGVASTLYELGGSVVFHDPGGCIGSYFGYDEPRALDGGARVYTSALDDMQALLGLDGSLVSACTHAHRSVNGDFVAIIGTPNPMVLGTDLPAVAREVSATCGVPGLGFSTTGTCYYDRGIRVALLELARSVVLPRSAGPLGPQGKRRINLLGCTPLDLTSQRSVAELRSFLEDRGWTVASCWAMGSSLTELSAGMSADVNVVVTASALPLARWMHSELGIPYTVGGFAGVRAAQTFADRLERVAKGLGENPSDAPALQGSRRAIVIGEQLRANSLRAALEADCDCGAVDVWSFFDLDPAYARPGDRGLIGEEELMAQLRDVPYDLVVGDGLLQAFLPQDYQGAFVAVPHLAISSRLAWNNHVCQVGAPFVRIVEQALGEVR